MLDVLNDGETVRFANDHNPLPLLDELRTQYGKAVTIRYEQHDSGAIVIDFVKKLKRRPPRTYLAGAVVLVALDCQARPGWRRWSRNE